MSILSKLFKVNTVETDVNLYKRASEQGETKDTERKKSKADPKSNPFISSQTSTEKKFYAELSQKNDKKYKFSQAGLKLAKKRLDPEAYTKLTIQAHDFKTKRNEYRRKRREIRRERFKIGTQTEQDVIERLLDSERKKRERAEFKKIKQKQNKKKGIQDTNHALAQLFPSKSFKDRTSKPSKQNP